MQHQLVNHVFFYCLVDGFLQLKDIVRQVQIFLRFVREFQLQLEAVYLIHAAFVLVFHSLMLCLLLHQLEF